MISILIPTKNEEQNLPGCLDSVRWSDDIHVYDSGSTDRTVEIAKGAKTNVVVRLHSSKDALFGGDEAAHKNWALANIPFRHKWILHVDADERVTPELAHEIKEAIKNPGEKVAFQIRRRDFLGDRWLKHIQATPFYIRLYQPSRMQFARLINPVSLPNGPVGRVQGHINHYPFSKGYAHWLDRHNAYSTLEARQIIASRQKQPTLNLRKALFAKEFTERRCHQKELFYKLPARPLAKFVLLYLIKGGFLDGEAGLTYAVLQSFYEYMIALKCQGPGD